MRECVTTVISDTEGGDLINGLMQLGFALDNRVMDVSVSFVDHIPAQTFDVWVHRAAGLFWIRHYHGPKVPHGVYVTRRID